MHVFDRLEDTDLITELLEGMYTELPEKKSKKAKWDRQASVCIQKKKAFTVAGVNEQNINSSLCPSVWDDILSMSLLTRL